VYSVTLYCSNDDCVAVFDGCGPQEAIDGALCPFCCCSLGEVAWTPVECPPEDCPPHELELWTVQEPLDRRESASVERLSERRRPAPARRAA
jgi:hypothetical protein